MSGILTPAIKCPACGSMAVLTLEDKTKVISIKDNGKEKTKVLKGKFYVYECTNEDCSERWTSTSSDKESLNSFKHKKL